MTPESAQKLFLVAAIFNWIVALGLFFVPGLFLSLFFVAPLPEQSVWVQQFAGLVFVPLASATTGPPGISTATRPSCGWPCTVNSVLP